MERGRLVSPIILSNVLGDGYVRALFMIAQPVIPEAPNTRAR